MRKAVCWDGDTVRKAVCWDGDTVGKAVCWDGDSLGKVGYCSSRVLATAQGECVSMLVPGHATVSYMSLSPTCYQL